MNISSDDAKKKKPIRKKLLVQLGVVMVPICIVIMLLIGNLVTKSSFVSYLKTIHDRNDSHLSDMENHLRQFASLPWLVDYWIAHSDEVAKKAALYENEKNTDFSDSLFGVTCEEAAAYDAQAQLDFAVICYLETENYFVKEYTVHKLDELFLITVDPDNNATTIINAKDGESGRVSLGERINLDKAKIEWDNYEHVISEGKHWIWGRFRAGDDFGFYRTVTLEDGHSMLLCNSFRKEEVYEHLRFMASFRTMALFYILIGISIVMIVLYFMVIRPISLIGKTITEYEKNKDADAVVREMSAIKTDNEIGGFAGEFASLAVEMDRYTDRVMKLAGEKERVNTELRMAKEIQSSALPSVHMFDNRPEFDIYALMQPARAVGGDFYDFFLLDEDHLVFAIGDVSDKGVPAALFMMSVKNHISYSVHKGKSPSTILYEVNSRLMENNSAMMFVTVLLGILDLSTGCITVSNAGHEMPVIKTAEGKCEFLDLKDMGCALGIRKDKRCADQSVQLGRGDMIYLYTDGVTESKNDQGEFYGRERLLAALKKTEKNSPMETVSEMQDDISLFSEGAEQFDDITMLSIKYNGR